MRRLLVSSAVLVFVSCASAQTSSSNARFQDIANESQRQTAALRKASDDASVKCGELREKEIGWAEERFVGERLAVKVIANNGKPASDDVNKYVAVVGRNLARYSPRPDIAWTFAVIENDAARTMSTPGGYVFITTGAMKKLANEAQLAALLGHEIGNVTTKRGLNAYKKSRDAQCTTALTMKGLIDAGVMPPENMAMAAKYATKFERFDLDASDDDGFATFVLESTMQMLAFSDVGADYESDKTGLQVLAFAGYDAREFEAVLELLGDQRDGHAPSANRIEKLKALREGELAPFAVGTAKPNLKVVQ